MAGGRGKYLAASVSAASLCWAVTASAQVSTDNGLDIVADFESELVVDDNRGLAVNSPGVTTTLNNRLSFGILSETPVSSLALRLGANLRIEERPSGGGDNGFHDPSVQLDYSLSGANSLLTATARYATSRVSDTSFVDLDGDLLADDLIVDEGDLERINFGVRFASGIEGPLGYSIELTRDERDYSDVTDVDLFDRTTDTAEFIASMQLSPVARGRVILQWEDYSAEDEDLTNRTTTGYGFGVEYAINPALTIDAELINQTIDTETTILGITSATERDELVGNLILTQELPNGTAGLEFSHTIREFSDRTSLEFDRAFELPNGSFAFGIGVSDSSTGSSSVVGSLDYTQELVDGMISLGLRQSASTNEDSEDVLTTSIDISYLKEITAASALDVSFGLGRSEDAGAGSVDEITRAEFEIALRRELTEEWDWRVGYRARYSKEVGAPSANSNAIFATIDRSFSLRP